MRILLAITPRGPRHDPAVPWWRVEYRQNGLGRAEYVEARTRAEAAGTVGAPGIRVLRVERVGRDR